MRTLILLIAAVSSIASAQAQPKSPWTAAQTFVVDGRVVFVRDNLGDPWEQGPLGARWRSFDVATGKHLATRELRGSDAVCDVIGKGRLICRVDRELRLVDATTLADVLDLSAILRRELQSLVPPGVGYDPGRVHAEPFARSALHETYADIAILGNEHARIDFATGKVTRVRPTSRRGHRVRVGFCGEHLPHDGPLRVGKVRWNIAKLDAMTDAVTRARGAKALEPIPYGHAPRLLTCLPGDGGVFLVVGTAWSEGRLLRLAADATPSWTAVIDKPADIWRAGPLIVVGTKVMDRRVVAIDAASGAVRWEITN